MCPPPPTSPQNGWAWVGDHDINGGGTVNVQNPRGVLVEGVKGPLYFFGIAAEHSLLYQVRGSHTHTHAHSYIHAHVTHALTHVL